MLREIDDFDKQAERESIALKKQRRTNKQHKKHIRQQREYNLSNFDKLFGNKI